MELKERTDFLCAASGPLLRWFSENRRELPFRKDRTPYTIYISEIMLQQTRISAVIPYYLRFIGKYPDIAALASAEEEELMKLWEGLGYYSRARNLKKAAEKCMECYGGELPHTLPELLSLPGVGSYTAGAVLSLAEDRRVPVVDGNVLRVLARFFADDSDIADTKTKKNYENIIGNFLQSTEVSPAAFNEALMELGEVCCKPNGAPDCGSCPLRELCEAERLQLTGSLPVKSSGKKKRDEERTVIFFNSGEKLAIVKNPEAGLLGGLYALPSVEGRLRGEEITELLREEETGYVSVGALAGAVHEFSHITWHMSAYRVRCEEIPEAFLGRTLLPVTEEELGRNYALPGAYRKWDLFPSSEEL